MVVKVTDELEDAAREVANELSKKFLGNPHEVKLLIEIAFMRGANWSTERSLLKLTRPEGGVH